MKYVKYEKWDMIFCFIKPGKNVEAASNYHERYQEKRQPFGTKIATQLN